MAGTALTSGFDLVLQVNANNFASAVEANPRLRSLTNLGVIPLGPLDPSNPPPTLTFRPPLQVRFYRSSTTGATFDLDLALDDAQYVSPAGDGRVSLGAGRSYVRVTSTLERRTTTIVPPPPTTPPQPTQKVHLFITTRWGDLQFIPADSTVTRELVASIRSGLISFLSSTADIDLTGMGIPMTPDAVPDPIPGGQVRDLAPVMLTGSASTVDAVAIGIRLLQASRPVPSGLMAAGSNVGPLEAGTLILNNGFVFAQVRTGLIGAGIAPGDISVDVPPTTLTIRSGASAFGATILSFTLIASGNVLQLNAVLQLPIPTHTVIYTGTGPVSFAFARGGLVVGTNLTSNVDVRINGLGAFIIGALAVIGAAISVASFGSGTAAVGAIAFGVGVAAGFVIGRMIDELAQAIFRALGPTIQVQLAAAFQGAGGAIPQNLLTGLGATMNFEPPIVFDDLKIGVSLRQLSPVGELRREDGVFVPSGGAFDLDAGVVRIIGEAGADLEWRDATIRAAGGARIVVIAGGFLDLTHADLERLVVGSSASVSAFMIPTILAGTRVPEPLVLGVRTDQLRYAKIAVWKDSSGRLIFRYVLYNDLAPSARIIGGVPIWRRVETVQDPDTPAESIWESARHNFRDAHEGSFRTFHHRLQLPVSYRWRLDRYDLALPSGAVRIGSEMVSYSIHNDMCVLRTSVGGSFRASLSCFVTDAAGITVSDEMVLQVEGHRSVGYGHSEAEMILNSVRQFEINRAFFILGDYLPDPPPDVLYRVTDAGIEQAAFVAVPSLEVSLEPSALIHAAELAIGNAFSPPDGKPVDIRIA
jgi:hypothetical protein